MSCKLCDQPTSALGLCKKHYRADLRARHRANEPIRPHRKTSYYQDLIESIKRELGK